MTDTEYRRFVQLWLAGATTAELAMACSVDPEGVEEWTQWALHDPAAVAGWTGRPEPIGRSRECVWIAGDVQRPGWAYCGAPSLPGRSWCPAHAEMARLDYRPPKLWVRAWR